jgi:hypothetical protein
MTSEEFEGQIHNVNSLDELMELIGKISDEDKPKEVSHSIPSFGEHRCNECELSTHCPIELSARYFGDEREIEESEVLSGIAKLLSGEFLHVLKAYFIHSGTINPLDIQFQTLMIVASMGYVIGKTGQPWPKITLPEQWRILFGGLDPRD